MEKLILKAGKNMVLIICPNCKNRSVVTKGLHKIFQCNSCKIMFNPEEY